MISIDKASNNALINEAYFTSYTNDFLMALNYFNKGAVSNSTQLNYKTLHHCDRITIICLCMHMQTIVVLV